MLSPLLLLAVAAFLIPAPAHAQKSTLKAPRLVPYHQLLLPGADVTATDAALRGAVVAAMARPQQGGVRAQTSYIPYYNKNLVRYDKFDWHIYKTDHFEVFYYPETERHLERISSYAESAYQHISAELKHDLAERVPLVIFKTESEFQENNIMGGETAPGILAFAEPERNRMVLPIDMPSDQLYALITHELTHIFEFDIIPRGLISTGLPLWVDEGLADYMTGSWEVLDLMAVRDAALTDNVPKMSRLYSVPLSGRTPYSLGHATFEFIESRWGKEGLRQFLFSLRKSVLGSGDTAYEEALKLKPEDFDEQFDRWMKERFKPFRDKERPADYGRNLAPDPERTPYTGIWSIEPSASGDLIAAVAANPRDQELDIILLSALDGQIIRNLTRGLDKDRGFEYISTPGGLRGNLVPWIAWSPAGDELAYFVRTEKERTLVIQNVVTGKVERRWPLKTINGPESPAFSPDGKTLVFSAMSGGQADLFTITLATGELKNLTNDSIADYSPTYAPDAKSIVYTSRTGSNDKLFQIDLSTGTKRQITFGSHDDDGARFYDDHTLVFSSTATDPGVSIPMAVARNGNIPNVWTLDLNTKQLRQWTDTATGNVSPIVLRQAAGPRVAFISYHKGMNGLNTISNDKPVAVVASDDFGGPGQTFDFTAPISHTLLRDNMRKKGAFEKMRLAGRPPVAVGVSSGGDLYGNTQITFTDVLGDKEVSFYAQSELQYRTTALTYTNTGRRFQYAFQGFSQDQFLFGTNSALYDPSLSPFISRDLAEAVQTQRGGTVFGIYPFNRYTRVELSGGLLYLSEHYNDPLLQQAADQYQEAAYGTSTFRNGYMAPFGVSLVNESTVFREYGPVAGSTYKLSYNTSPSFGDSWLSRQTLEVDARHYSRMVANGVFAVRLNAQKSVGSTPDLFAYGGNSEMRGYEYLEFLGQQGFFANAELRFPIIEAMLTPIGVLGGLRGVFFANLGGSKFNNQSFNFGSARTGTTDIVTGYELDQQGNIVNTRTQTYRVTGLRLIDARASYGLGLQSFMFGFPMHFDFSWKTLLNKEFEDISFRQCAYTSATNIDCTGAGPEFRKMKFSFWVGYDF